MGVDAETMAAYAERVDEYLSLSQKDKPEQDLREFIAALPKSGHVLDLGCGPGMYAATMLAAGLTVDATDASPEMVAIAREHFHLNARQAQFSDLDANGAYDGVLASFSLLHAPKSDFPDHLTRIQRALKPGGLLVLAMKIGTGEHRDSLGRFYAYYTVQELTDHLSHAGFSEIQTKRTGRSTGLSGDAASFAILYARA